MRENTVALNALIKYCILIVTVGIGMGTSYET